MSHFGSNVAQDFVHGLCDPSTEELLCTHLASCSETITREAALETVRNELGRELSFCPACQQAASDELSRCMHCGAAISVGHYTIVEVRASSQHGRLYVGQDDAGRCFAIKEIVFTQVPSMDVLDAFEREARMLRQLTHARIPKLHDTFQIGAGVQTRCYLVQDLIEGVSLATKLRSHRYSEEQAIDIAQQVLAILQDLQALTPPVFHRDIKPANLIVAKDGKISLVDFGAARAEGATANATLVGTYGYMPSEQLAGVIGKSSDLYALGASLIELLTRTSPWRALADKDKALGRISSAHLRRWLDRLTQARPEDRYADAAEAARALAHKSWPPAGWQRHPATLLSAAAATAALVSVSIFSFLPPRLDRTVGSIGALDAAKNDPLSRALRGARLPILYDNTHSGIPGLTESFKRQLKLGDRTPEMNGEIARGLASLLMNRALTWEDAAQLWPCTRIFFSQNTTAIEQLNCVRSIDLERVDFNDRFLRQKKLRVLRDFREIEEIQELSAQDKSRLDARRASIEPDIGSEANVQQRLQRNLDLNALQSTIVVAFQHIRERWRHMPTPSEWRQTSVPTPVVAQTIEAPPPPTPALVKRPIKRKLSPADQLYQQGNRYVLMGRFRDANAQYNQALRIDPRYANAHRGLGIAYARLHKNDKAMLHYRRYIEKQPYAQDADKVRQILRSYGSDLLSDGTTIAPTGHRPAAPNSSLLAPACASP